MGDYINDNVEMIALVFKKSDVIFQAHPSCDDEYFGKIMQ